MNKHVSALLKQSKEERLLAVETIWESLEDETPSLAFSKNQMKLIDERINKYESGQMKFQPYEKAMKKLMKKHGLGT